MRTPILSELNDQFESNLGDDTFVSHYLMTRYGRNAIACAKTANVRYQPVQSVQSWWHKWSRIWKDLDTLYQKNPEFRELKSIMQTKIDWAYVRALPPKYTAYFILERALHHGGHMYFNFIKNKKEIGWRRLDDTKVL